MGELKGALEYQFRPSQPQPNTGSWGKLGDVDPKIRQRFIQVLPYWRVTEKLEELVATLDRYDDLRDQVAEVFTYVRKTVRPENLPGRKGVLQLLDEEIPYGDCDEYTDLTTAILRVMGIPVRRVTGMVARNVVPGQEVRLESLHAWAEVYAPQIGTWVPVDPALNIFGFWGKDIIPLMREGTRSDRLFLRATPRQAHPETYVQKEMEDPLVKLELPTTDG